MNATPRALSTPLTPFSHLIARLQTQGDGFSIVLPDDWLQGRTAYGGLSAAVCLEAARRAFADLPALRSAQFAFAGPATGALQVTPTLLRQGKSAAFVGVDLAGDGGLAVRGTLCFGAARQLPHDHVAHPFPVSPPREACPDYYGWPNQPNFMHHFDGRLAAGSGPMTAGPVPTMRVWLRHRDAEVARDPVSLFALADALPPAAFAMMREPVPISTMTWSIDLLDADLSDADPWWLVESAAETVRDGYSAQTTVIWRPDGRVVLVARQMVGIFARR